MGKEKQNTTTPFEPHDADEVIVEVVFDGRVKEHGRFWEKGDVLRVMRGHAMAQNTPGRQVYRVISTYRYAHDPDNVVRAEQQDDAGPKVLEIS